MPSAAPRVPRPRPPADRAPAAASVTPAAPAAPSPAVVARARVLLLGLFGLTGITFSSWLARIPTVRDLLDLSTAELGAMLLVGSLGALVTVSVAGVVVQRYGSRHSLLASTAVLAVGYVLMGIGPTVGSVALLAAGVFLNGIAIPLGNLPINVESARIERAMGRTVIPQFHAAFSIGAVTGSGIGAAASHAGVPLTVQFSAIAAVVVVWRLASLRGVVLATTPDEHARSVAVPPPAPRRPGRAGRLASALDAWREPRTLLIGVVLLAAALSEGSANDWLSLAVVDGFASTEAVGGVVLGVFVAAMTLVRLLGTRLLDRYGRVAVLRASGIVSLVGLLLFGFAPSLVLAGAGVAAWGFGAALAVPIAIAAASDDPLRAAGRVAVISSFSSVASIAAPPLLGFAAEAVGARHALVLLAVALVLSIALAHVVRPDRAETPSPGAADLPTAAPTPVLSPAPDMIDTDDAVPAGAR